MSKKIDQIYEILQRDRHYHPQQEGNSVEHAARIVPEVEPEPLPSISSEAAKGVVVRGVKESAGFKENDLDLIQDLEILNVIEYWLSKTEDVLQTARQIPPVTYLNLWKCGWLVHHMEGYKMTGETRAHVKELSRVCLHNSCFD